MSEIALFYELASERLTSRCRLLGPVLLASALVPYEVVDNTPQFLWQLLGEIGPAGALAALAPSIAGAVLFAASYVVKRSAHLAVVVLASLAAAAIFVHLGEDAAAWDVLPLPESLGARPVPVLLSLALTAAGVRLAAKPHARKVARGALFASLALAALYYARPARGEAPAATIAGLLGALVSAPYFRLMLGFAILTAMAVAPAVIAAAGVVRAYVPPRSNRPALAIIAVYGPPSMMLLLVYRSFFSAAVGAHILGTIGATFVTAALLVLIASAAEVLGEAIAIPEGEVVPNPGRGLRRTATLVLAVAAPACLLQWALARPPTKGIEWTLRAESDDGDKLFGELVTAWDDARAARPASDDDADPAARSAQATVDEAARRMIDAAAELDAGVSAALSELASASLDLHVGGRRFYRLVASVNEATRAASLPYYLDPVVGYAPTGDGLKRHLRVNAYRVERVSRFEVGSSGFATLHVRSLQRPRASLRLLGLSRDVQPFALVVLDEVEPFARDLTELASASPPACGRSQAEEAKEGLARCGDVLAALAARLPEGLLPALTAITERHELQHQIDGPHLPLSRAVRRRLAGFNDDAQKRVNRELSAYLTEIVADAAPPSLGLIHLLRFAVLSRGTAEHHVAVIALEALSKRSMGRGALATAEAGRAFAELAAMDDEALRARASEAWEGLFGGSLPEVTRARDAHARSMKVGDEERTAGMEGLGEPASSRLAPSRWPAATRGAR